MVEAVHEIVGKVWPWIIAGIAVGAFIHGYVPADLLATIMGRDAWWSVPAAVLIGIPMYSNAAGIIPVVEALLGKGAALGTVLAFMMSVIALSLPEMIILRKVLTMRLIAVFVGVVGSRHPGSGLPVQRAVQLTEMSMKDVKVLGPGCKRCVATAEMVQKEADKLGVPVEIEKVTDYAAIAGYGIASTPGIVIDGKVVHAGGLPKTEDLARWLAA